MVRMGRDSYSVHMSAVKACDVRRREPAWADCGRGVIRGADLCFHSTADNDLHVRWLLHYELRVILGGNGCTVSVTVCSKWVGIERLTMGMLSPRCFQHGRMLSSGGGLETVFSFMKRFAKLLRASL